MARTHLTLSEPDLERPAVQSRCAAVDSATRRHPDERCWENRGAERDGRECVHRTRAEAGSTEAGSTEAHPTEAHPGRRPTRCSGGRPDRRIAAAAKDGFPAFVPAEVPAGWTVTDATYALLGDGQVSLLPRGVEEYLERRAAALSASTDPGHSGAGATAPKASAAETRGARKTVARIDKQLARITEREQALHAELVEHAADYEHLATVHVQLRELAGQKESLEEQWLSAATLLEG